MHLSATGLAEQVSPRRCVPIIILLICKESTIAGPVGSIYIDKPFTDQWTIYRHVRFNIRRERFAIYINCLANTLTIDHLLLLISSRPSKTSDCHPKFLGRSIQMIRGLGPNLSCTRGAGTKFAMPCWCSHDVCAGL